MEPASVDWQREDTLTQLRAIAPRTTNHRLSNPLFWSFLRQWPAGLGTEYVTVSSDHSLLVRYHSSENCISFGSGCPDLKERLPVTSSKLRPSSRGHVGGLTRQVKLAL